MTSGIRSGSLPLNTKVGTNLKTISAPFTPMMTTVIIFFVTAVIGVWAAPDRSVASSRLVLFVIGLFIMAGGAWGSRKNTETILGAVGILCGILAGAVAAYFLLTTNWAENGRTHSGLVNEIGLWLHRQVLDLSQLPDLHKNLTGGIMTVLFPLSLIGTVWVYNKRAPILFVCSIVCLLMALVGLLMSLSRGAWLGYIFGLIYAAYFYWRVGAGSRSRIRWVGDALLFMSILFILGGFWLVMTNPEYQNNFSLIFGDSAISRPNLWRDSLMLIQDYPFTGSGLGSTTMVYSTYVFLLHVPFLTHAHNLFLQIAIEQGLPGLITFIVLTVYSFWALVRASQRGNTLLRLYCTLTVASLTGLLVHGMLDAELYTQPLMPVMFLPFSFTIALLLATNKMVKISHPEFHRMQRVAVLGAIAPTAFVLTLFLWPGSLANVQANLGTVAQTRAELSVYQWPDWSIQDELRRQNGVDLTGAIEHYQTALAIEPTNVTALRRLGQIEISEGDYEAAQHHLEAAFRVSPDQRATRQMLGEIYAIRGELTKAVEFWQPLDVSHGQLEARLWWHSYVDSEQQAEFLQQAILQLNQARSQQKK